MDATRELIAILEGQTRLNTIVTAALDEAMHEIGRLDAELAELRDVLLALSHRIDAVSRSVIRGVGGAS